jgi:hypothetical protein
MLMSFLESCVEKSQETIITWSRVRASSLQLVFKKSMIRKLKSGEYRLYSRKTNKSTGKRRNLGTFKNLAAAKKHEQEIQYFKRS